MPEGASVNPGDKVRVMETRPISKTKNFIFVENLSATEEKPKKEKENAGGKSKNN